MLYTPLVAGTEVQYCTQSNPNTTQCRECHNGYFSPDNQMSFNNPKCLPWKRCNEKLGKNCKMYSLHLYFTENRNIAYHEHKNLLKNLYFMLCSNLDEYKTLDCMVLSFS